MSWLGHRLQHKAPQSCQTPVVFITTPSDVPKVKEAFLARCKAAPVPFSSVGSTGKSNQQSDVETKSRGVRGLQGYVRNNQMT